LQGCSDYYEQLIDRMGSKYMEDFW
jgi:hypothetical protein